MSRILFENTQNEIFSLCKESASTSNPEAVLKTAARLQKIMTDEETIKNLGADYNIMLGMMIANQIGVLQKYKTNSEIVSNLAYDIKKVLTDEKNFDAIGSHSYERLTKNACARMKETKEDLSSDSIQVKLIDKVIKEVTQKSFSLCNPELVLSTIATAYTV